MRAILAPFKPLAYSYFFRTSYLGDFTYFDDCETSLVESRNIVPSGQQRTTNLVQ